MLTFDLIQFKSKNLQIFIVVFIFSLIILTSCSKSDEIKPDETDISLIFDKWWYDSDNSTADIYIHSDGRYEQRNIDSDVITDTGNWIWEDKNLAFLKIDYDEGTDQILSSLWIKFSDIKKHTITVHPSNNGTDFFFTLFYSDTKN